VDPKNVKLPIKVRLKILFEVLLKNEGACAAGLIFLIWLPGLGMALCIPTITTGAISSFIMTFLLSLLFGAIFLGIFMGGFKLWEDEIAPGLDHIINEYKVKILPLQKKAMEEVDDILLK